MATTTNYGWTTPNDTGYVKDGASDIRSLGNAVDAALYPVNYVATNAQTGTTYTLALTDATKVVSLSNASAITLTVPTNTVAFPIGTQILLYQAGAGQVTVSPAATVTVRSQGTKTKMAGQYAVAALIKIATNEWVLAGNIVT